MNKDILMDLIMLEKKTLYFKILSNFNNAVLEEKRTIKSKEVLKNKNKEIKELNKTLHDKLSKVFSNDLQKLSILLEGFTGRDIRNVTKIMIKQLVTLHKENNKIENINNFSNKILSNLEKVKNLYDLTEEYKKDYIFNKIINNKLVREGIKKIINEKTTDGKKVDIKELVLYSKLFEIFDDNEIKKILYLDGKEIEKLFNDNDEILTIAGIEFLNKYYGKIINEGFLSKIITLNYIIDKLKKDTIGSYFNSIEEYIIGKDKGMEVNDELLKRIAIHELGHAVNGYLAGKNVLKVAIGAKNMSLGQTFSVNEKEKILKTDKDFYEEIKELLGGRAAEKIILGNYSTGAFNDYERATKLAINFFMNNMEYKTKNGKKLKLGLVINTNDPSTRNLFDGKLKEQSLEYSKIMIEELEKQTEENIKKNKKIIEKYTKYLVKNKVLIGNKLKEFLSEIK